MSLSTPTLGRYRLVREIARSNDIVYEALDPTMGRRVAVKELWLPPTLQGAAREERRERFRREARAAGGLSHPNIVTVYDIGEEAGRLYVAMEYLEGPTLRQTLQVTPILPVHRAVEIALQVLAALGYAHSQGIVHRDVKPDNVHLQPDGVVKLTDFGIARILAEPSLTAAGQVFGTPSYMSPEQVAGRPVDNRSDLFSLGVMLYEMVAGHKPFRGDTVVTITYQILSEQPGPIPGVSASLWFAIQRALEKSPDARYATAEAMAAELRTCQLSASAAWKAPAAAPEGWAPPPSPGPSPPPTDFSAWAGAAGQSAPEPQPTWGPPSGATQMPPPTGLYLAESRRPKGRSFQRLTALALLVVVGTVLYAFGNQAFQKYAQADREGTAQRVLERAVVAQDPAKWWQIVMSVAKDYPDTAAGRQAKGLIGRQREQDAQQALRQATANTDPRTWGDAVTRVAQDYADTRAGGQARDLLRRYRRPVPPSTTGAARQPSAKPDQTPQVDWQAEVRQREARAQQLVSQADRTQDEETARRLYTEALTLSPTGQAAERARRGLGIGPGLTP
ncbi:MAG TPA: serine/threonine-protein kinase [Armatimonadota bacterium]|jgi:serine/threonine protein kinase